VPKASRLYRRLHARRVHLFDAALALLLVVLSNVRVDPAPGSDQALAVWWIFTAVMVAGLLIRHRWPLAALSLTAVAALAHWAAPGYGCWTCTAQAAPDGSWAGFPLLIDLAVPITLYTLASRGRSRRRSLTALAVLMIAEVVMGVLLNPLTSPAAKAPAKGPEAAVVPAPPRDPAGPATPEVLGYKLVEPGLAAMLVLALAYALGDGTRLRHAHLRTLEQRTADLEREQHQRVALAAVTERARIGRDLHDVVAHSLTVMIAQAQAATAAQLRHPDRAAQALREVVTVGRESLSEMRRLVAAFGPDPDHGLAPPAGVAALPTLIERVQAAGVPVRFTPDGALPTLPTGIDTSVYRIVQEALTNTLKHAGPGAQATVRLTVHPDHLDVEVGDDGRGTTADPADPAGGRGNGLRGIAERVHLLGGTLTAGPVPDRGFVVRAHLPVSTCHHTPAEPVGTEA
jgi:signal transduction histidine kinase